MIDPEKDDSAFRLSMEAARRTARIDETLCRAIGSQPVSMALVDQIEPIDGMRVGFTDLLAHVATCQADLQRPHALLGIAYEE